jgi:hypothetical protein
VWHDKYYLTIANVEANNDAPAEKRGYDIAACRCKGGIKRWCDETPTSYLVAENESYQVTLPAIVQMRSWRAGDAQSTGAPKSTKAGTTRSTRAVLQ